MLSTVGRACTLPYVETIIGQDKAIAVLQRACNDGRRHHAWVFSGMRGVGKFTTAVTFAELIIGIEKNRSTTHPDLHIIKKEDVVWSNNPSLQRKKQTNIPMDLLRERMIGGKTSDDRNHDSVAFKTPVLGKEKVFIIDEAELLSESAQNILLKTLEEPPAGTTIILVTSRDDLLLPTILSRCQQVGFAPLDNASIQRWAEQALPDVSPSDLSLAIRFSCGSPGLVCEAIDSELPKLVGDLSGFLDRKQNANYTTATTTLICFVETYVEKRLKDNPLASKDSVNRAGIELVLMMFGAVVRKMVRSNQDDVGILASTIISDIERQLSTNISVKVLLESLAARWSHLCVGDSLPI